MGYVIALICFLIADFILKNLHKTNRWTKEVVKIHYKLYMRILLIFVCLVPILNIVALMFLIFVVIADKDLTIITSFKEGSIISKIHKILTKEL